MVVDELVAAALRGQSEAKVATFVASCAERMVQVFTGLSGGDCSRVNDADVVIRLVEDLWAPGVTAASFQGYVASLEGFQELEGADEEIVDVAGIYSFYALLVLRYAALYRSTSEAENAIECAHACLTAMGQLDRNLRSSGFFAQEAEIQKRVNIVPPLVDGRVESILSLREGDRTVSRERLAAIRGRLTH